MDMEAVDKWAAALEARLGAERGSEFVQQHKLAIRNHALARVTLQTIGTLTADLPLEEVTRPRGVAGQGRSILDMFTRVTAVAVRTAEQLGLDDSGEVRDAEP